ncbi:MAG: DUF4416 family protein [Planctomycetes bacterium]|nr:DUF4416 family protein [Planctomycetota bacterium]
MGEVRPVRPVKLFIGLLAGRPGLMETAVERCSAELGEVEKRLGPLPFDHTDYYAAEMGSKLMREIVTFRPLIDPDRLPGIKLRTNELEAEIARLPEQPVARPVNLDPGYVSTGSVVLATTKNYSHRLYLGQGIYGEVTLHFQEGSFRSWPWTYPDYQTPATVKFFNEVRARYMGQLKGQG